MATSPTFAMFARRGLHLAVKAMLLIAVCSGCEKMMNPPPPLPPGGRAGPVFAAMADQLVRPGETLRFVLRASDPEGRLLRYSGELPAGATLDPWRGEFAFQPAASQIGRMRIRFTVTAFESEGQTSVVSASIEVTVVVLGPVTVLAPAEGLLVRVASQAIEGVASSGTAVVVELNGTPQSVALGDDGRFRAEVALAEGLNTIRAFSTGPFGGGAPAVLHMTLKTIPPHVAITSPTAGRAAHTDTVRVAGTVDDIHAQVVVNGQPATMSGPVWVASGIPLSLGTNHLSAVATDIIGNSSTTTLDIERRENVVQGISISPGGARLTAAGASLPLGVSGVYSDLVTATDLTPAGTGTTYGTSNPIAVSVDPSGRVTALENGSAVITARNGAFSATATIVVELGVRISALSASPAALVLRQGATAQLSLTGAFSDGSTRDMTRGAAGTSYSSSNPAAVGVSADGLVSGLDAGSALLTAQSETLTATVRATVAAGPGAGGGFVRGQVLDDRRGLPLAGALVSLLSDGSGPLPVPRTATSGADGRFVLAGASGDALVRVEKDGFTAVERTGTIPVLDAVSVLDARLTPLDGQMNTISPALGGRARDAQSMVRLDLPPGAVSSSLGLVVTPLGTQGLAAKLPLGWSPVGAVEVDPAGVSFGQPAVLRLANTANLPAATTVTAAAYDFAAHGWRSLDAARVSADGGEIDLTLRASGQVALLVPDAPPLAPPVASGGSLLAGAPASPLPDPSLLSAQGSVAPRSATPEGARAEGRMVLRGPTALPSGTVLKANVSERYTLLDASVVVPPSFQEDIVFYATPRAASVTALSATFPISPSRAYTIHDLELGVIRVTALAGTPPPAGTVIGASGGRVSDPSGLATFDIRPGSLAADTLGVLSTLTADDASIAGTIPDGFALAGAVKLDLAGASLSSTGILSIAAPATLSPSAEVVVAKLFLDPTGVPRLRAVAVADPGAALIASRTTVGSLTLPGITEGGVYLFLASNAPLGFVTGTVFAAAGGPAPLALVTADSAPFADLASASGGYLVAAGLGTSHVTAILQSSGDAATVTASLAAQEGVAVADVTLASAAPFVASLSPSSGARNVPVDTSITVSFSAPIVPASVNAVSLSLLDAGGAPVTATALVSPDGRSATLTPAAPLASFASYTIAIASTVADAAGHALLPFAGASFTTLDTSIHHDPAGSITATAPDARGLVTVSGTQGSADPGGAVSVIDNTSGVITTAIAASDGSFSLRTSASTTDLLTVDVSSGGNHTKVQIGAYQNPDGSVTLGELGGRISAPTANGPISLDIPAGALAARATVKVTPLSDADAIAALAQQGLSIPAPPTFNATPLLAAALRIDAGGVPAKTRVTLSVPVPPSLVARAAAAGVTLTQVQTVVARVEPFTDENGATRNGFRQVDTAEVKDGRLVDGLPEGIQGFIDGLYLFFAFPDNAVGQVGGSVKISRDPTNPAFVPVAAPGALVRVLPSASVVPIFYAVAGGGGGYFVSFPAFGSDTGVAVSATRADALPAIGNGNATLFGPAATVDLVMQSIPPPPDTTPPTVRILVDSPIVTLGMLVTITATVTDDDNSDPAALDASLIAGFSISGPAGASVTAAALARDPSDNRLKTTLATTVTGTYTIRATATDKAGNTSSPATLLLSVGDLPTASAGIVASDPADKVPPMVVSIDPWNGELGVAVESEITIRFSKPMDASRLAVSAAGAPIAVQVTPEGGALGTTVLGTVLVSPDQLAATFVPFSGLTPGTTYDVHVLTFARDLNGNALDQDPDTAGNQGFFSSFTTLPAADPVEITDVQFNVRRSLAKLGATLFFTDDHRIEVYDVGNPATPLKIGEIGAGLLDGQPSALAVVTGFSWLGLDGNPTYPPRQGFVGEATTPTPSGDMLFAVVQKDLSSGLSGAFLEFFDVTDPTSPQKIGTSQRLSFQSQAVKIAIANGRAFVKLVDAPNPGLAVVDLRLALIKATLLPIAGVVLEPSGATIPAPDGRPMIDVAAAPTKTASPAGDFLPDAIKPGTDIVGGRLVSPGDTTDFAPSGDGQRIFIADGMPQHDPNNTVSDPTAPANPDPNPGPYYWVTGMTPATGPNAPPRADPAGGLVVADMSSLDPVPLVDADQDGLDDRILARIDTPRDDTNAPSSRVLLAEGLTYTATVKTMDAAGKPITLNRVTTADIAFVSNPVIGTVTMLDVSDPRHPQRVAVITLPQVNGGQLEAVDLALQGSRLLVDTAGSGVAEIDLNRAVVIDENQSPPSYASLHPIDVDADGRDDRVIRLISNVPGSGVLDPSGFAFTGTLRSVKIDRVSLPALSFVRWNGSSSELASFHPESPGDGVNLKLITEPFLNPGRLHADPIDASAPVDGDQSDPNYVYFVYAILPGDASDDGNVPLTLESLDASNTPLPDLGYGFPPTSYGSSRLGASQPTRTLMLHRQIDTAHLSGKKGERLSSRGTEYVSDPIMLTREPLRAADVQSTSGPFLLWAGATVRASLAAATGTRLPEVYAPGVTDAASQAKLLASAKAVARSFAADFVDSPNPEPAQNPSTGMGEAAGPVFLHSGEFTWTETDLTIKGRGMDYAFVRRYESQSFYNGPLGRGWEFNFNMRLLELPEDLPSGYALSLPQGTRVPLAAKPSDVVFFDGLGRADVFGSPAAGPDPNEPDELVKQLNPLIASRYASPVGFFTQLLKLEDGTFIMIERDGTLRRFDAGGKLASITDRNANRIDLIYDARLRLRAVVDTLGRSVKLGYYKSKDPAIERDSFDPSLDIEDSKLAHDGKIARQVDFIGRTVQYAYDALNNLIKVTGPAVTVGNGDNTFPNGKTMAYFYTGQLPSFPRYSYQLQAIGFPRELAHDGHTRIGNVYSDGVLQSQIWGDPGTTLPIQFTYSDLLTTVTDRRGNPTGYTHDDYGHATSVVEKGPGLGGGVTTLRQFTLEGLLDTLTGPDLNTVTHVYDDLNPRRRAEGNVLYIARSAGPRLSSGKATLTTQYQSYELLHNLPGSVTDEHGNQTTFAYDGNGNVKTVTRATSPAIVERFEYNRFGSLTKSIDGEGNETAYEYYSEVVPDGSTATHSLRGTLDAATGASGGGYLSQVTIDSASGANAGVASGPGGGAPASSSQAASLVTKSLYGAFGGSAPSIGYAGFVTAVVDPRGVQHESGVNELGQIFRQVRATTAPTDGSGVPALSYETRTFFDENNQVTRTETQQDPFDPSRATVTTFEYDLMDNPKKMTVDPGGASEAPLVTTYDIYDGNQNLTQVTKPNKGVDLFEYNARDQRTKETRGSNDPSPLVVQKSYDANGNVRFTTDGNGKSVETQYDGFNRPKKVIDRMGNTTELTYSDTSHDVRTLTSKGPSSGQDSTVVILAQATSTYDEVGRMTDLDELISKGVMPSTGGPPTSDVTRHTHFDFDRNGRVVQTVDDNGHAARSYYDGANRLVRKIDALGNSVTYTRDANGNATKTTETEQGTDFVSTATYDALDRSIEAVDSIGNKRSVSYDAQGNALQTKDAEGTPIDTVFDLLNRPLTVTQKITGTTFQFIVGASAPAAPAATDIVTTYSYDTPNKRKTVKDAKGNETKFDYDSNGRPTTTTYADGTRSTERYDANGNVVAFTDRSVRLVTSGYDDSDRLTSRAITSLSGAVQDGDNDARKETFEYDGLGRMTRAGDEDSQVDRVYDALGRVTEETETPLHGAMQDFGVLTGAGATTKSSYDGVGNRLTVTYPSGIVVSTLPDELDRVASVSAAGVGSGALATYTYRGPTRLQSRTYGNGTTLTVGYANESSGDRRATKMLHGKAGAPRYDLRYAWTRENQRIGEQRMHEAGQPADLYEYDDAHRLVHALLGAQLVSGTALDSLSQGQGIGLDPSSSVQVERVYNLDGASNINSVQNTYHDSRQFALMPFPDSFGSPNTRNQVTQLEVLNASLLGLSSSLTLTPDTAGDISSIPFTRPVITTLASIRYDYRDRPVRIFYPGTSDKIIYRYDALGRRTGKIVTLNGTTTVVRYLHDGQREIEERDGSDTTQARYYFGRGEVIAMERLNASGSMDLRFLHENSMGSIVGLSDKDGVERETYHYDAYGETVVTGPQSYGNPWLFQGHRYDSETGLYFMDGRYYSPATGRFLEEDPAAYGNGSNASAAFGGDPVNNANLLDTMARWGGAPETPQEREHDAATGRAAIRDAVIFAATEGVGYGVGALIESVPWAGRVAARAGDALDRAAAALNPGGVRAALRGLEAEQRGMAVGAAVRQIRYDLKVQRILGMADRLEAALPAGEAAATEISSEGSAAVDLISRNPAEGLLGRAGLPSECYGLACRRAAPVVEGGCFVAGTRVPTEKGTKPIEEVARGDRVLSRDERTGKQEYRSVLDTYVTHPRTLFHIRYRVLLPGREPHACARSASRSGETGVLKSEEDRSGEGCADPVGNPSVGELVCTGAHPFWSPSGRRWVPARDLAAGHRLSLDDGSEAAVLSVTLEHASPGESFTTYNFQVEGYHTYFVLPRGASRCPRAVWVHNVCHTVTELLNLRDVVVTKRTRGLVHAIDSYDSPDALRPVVDSLINEGDVKVWSREQFEVFFGEFDAKNPGRNIIVGRQAKAIALESGTIADGLEGSGESFQRLKRELIHELVARDVVNYFGLASTGDIPVIGGRYPINTLWEGDILVANPYRR